MSHIHWVTRQNKLEISIDKDEANKREICECDGRAHDPDTMVAPPTPKPTYCWCSEKLFFFMRQIGAIAVAADYFCRPVPLLYFQGGHKPRRKGTMQVVRKL
jgi:hypothetical protein